MKKWLMIPLVMVCLFAFVGCKSGKAKEIEISGTLSINVSATTQLTATVSPAKADQSVTWSSGNEAIATVSASGLVKGIAAGRVSITATSVANPDLQQAVLITVRAGGGPERPDLQGYVITIMAKAQNEYDPFHRNADNEEDYAASDKEAKKAAFTAVKEMYNCDITVIDFPAGAEWGQTRIDYINLQASLGTPEADFYIVGSDWIPDFVEGGSVVDLTDLYGTYGEDKMDAAFRQACTYKERLYGMTNAGSGLINGLFYNLDLVEKLELDTPAKKFNNDEWTFSDFKEWALAAQAKMSEEGQYALSGHGIYYWYGMSISSGVKVANLDNLMLDYQNENCVNAAAVLKEIFEANAFDPAFSHDAGSVAFNTGKAIFCPGQFWFLNAPNRWKTYRDDLFDIGYVPFPYADDMSKEEVRVAMPDEAVYIMATGRSADQEAVYRAINEMFLLTRENVLNAPGYDEYDLRLQNAQRLTDDPESVTAIMYLNDKGDNPVNLRYFYDPLEGVYSFTQPDGLGPALRTVIQGGDYQQSLTAVAPIIDAAILRKFG